MANILYTVAECKNPINGNKGFRAIPKRYTYMKADEVVDCAAENSNIERNIIAAAMAGLTQIIRQFTLNGHNVTVDGLGCFMVSNSSEGEEEKGLVKANNVKKVKIYLRPSTSLRNALDTISLSSEK